MTDKQTTGPIITTYAIQWKHSTRLAIFERLLTLYPKAFSPDSPKPLSLSTQERLHNTVNGIVESLPNRCGYNVIGKTA